LLEIIKIIKDPDMNYVSSSKRWRRNGSIAGALQLGVFTGIIDTNLKCVSVFKNSTWNSGIWSNGLFEDGKFYGGLWYNGHFSGTWG
jgi:hypothetical protein